VQIGQNGSYTGVSSKGGEVSKPLKSINTPSKNHETVAMGVTVYAETDDNYKDKLNRKGTVWKEKGNI